MYEGEEVDDWEMGERVNNRGEAEDVDDWEEVEYDNGYGDDGDDFLKLYLRSEKTRVSIQHFDTQIRCILYP